MSFLKDLSIFLIILVFLLLAYNIYMDKSKYIMTEIGRIDKQVISEISDLRTKFNELWITNLKTNQSLLLKNSTFEQTLGGVRIK